MIKSEFTIEELKHELEENGKYLDEFSAYIGVPDALIAKLNRLAALEAVAREIIKESPPTPWSDDPEMNISQDTEWHVKYLIAQRLKAVLEEA